MTRLSRGAVQELLLMGAALFAIAWALVRACVQSITMDEAQTYLFFVARSDLWYPFSNNHVLNSLLMWMTTHAFGNSILAVRAPALLGGVLYVCICYFLCGTLTNRLTLQLPLFICLVYNPFIFDFMVAARGYGLADAFLLAAITVPVWHHVNRSPSLGTCCILASVGLGLSFTANFSFAFVDLAAFVVVVTWAIRRREGESVVRVAGLCALPGLFVALLICGYPLAHWKREDLWWGAHSLSEMTQSLEQSSLYQLEPRFRGSMLYTLMNSIGPWLPPLLIVLCICQIVATRFDGSWLRDARTRWMGKFAAALVGITILSLLMSWLAFRFANLPLPIGRTGIYLVPLGTLFTGVIAAAPARSLISRWLRRGITTVFICLGCYFLLCLRLNYFREYEWDADLKDVYSVLARLNHGYGVGDVAMNGLYLSSLDYYRMLSRGETFADFTLLVLNAPADKSIYVLHGANEREFLDKEKLVVIYRGKSTDVLVAVRPDGPIPPTMISP
jgi:4-amino-4-deoxy-L-arabinose transferase-like glycosyltransferase